MASPDNRFNEPEAYWIHLGRFVDTYTRVERLLQDVIAHFAGLKSAKGFALFSDTRVDRGLSLLRRLIELEYGSILTAEARTDFESALAQLGLINGVRNDLLHHGASSHVVGDKVTQVIRRRSLRFEETKRTPISAEILYQMELDLHKIIGHLSPYTPYAYAHQGRPVAAQKSGPPSRPWLYKPAPQDVLYPYRAPKARKQPRRPRSSRK